MLVLCLSFVLALLDQVTKHLARSRLSLGDEIRIIPGLFSLRYVQNTGAAWGILEGLNHWLVLLSAIALVALVAFRRHILTDTLTHRVAAGLMVGGIAGNLIDRVRLSFVVDFLDFYCGTHHFPAFNLADSGICVGVGLYLVSQYVTERLARTRVAAAAGAAPASTTEPRGSARQADGSNTDGPR
jgi:signal peptidase II